MRLMLKSKIHRARVTDAHVDYIGSISVDQELMEKADLLPYEQVNVLDIDNGARLETYAIPAPRGSGLININGAAARLIHRGDLVIILSYRWVAEGKAKGHQPRVVFVDEANRPKEVALAKGGRGEDNY